MYNEVVLRLALQFNCKTTHTVFAELLTTLILAYCIPLGAVPGNKGSMHTLVLEPLL